LPPEARPAAGGVRALLKSFHNGILWGKTMHMTPAVKNKIKNKVLEQLSSDKAIRKIVVFGSFVTSDDPEDIDLAIFSESDRDYLSQAMEYRKKLRDIAGQIPVDVIPVKIPYEEISFMEEINNGEVIYEK
jgi:predicted nucleotidyltransferase